MRCWRVAKRGQGARQIGWLIGQRPTRGEGDWDYYWSNFSQPTSLAKLVEYTHRRYWVEQFHEEAKGLLGWDQYQGRLWHGFHRNAALVMLSYSFLVWCEVHERQHVIRRGRPRRAFPPRLDRRRRPLAEVHRQVVDRLRKMAAVEWLIQYQPLRI